MTVSLDVWNDQVLSCRKCDLRQEDEPVPGLGPSTSRVVVVGEAPRGDDGLVGRPFEDRAGLNLKKLLRMAGLKHEECYLTFASKCQGLPAGEWRAMSGPCRSWLWGELQAVAPRVIVTLGWQPTRLLLQLKSTDKLEDHVGQLVPTTYLPNTLVAPWYSPAVVLRHGREMEKRTVEFFKRVETVK